MHSSRLRPIATGGFIIIMAAAVAGSDWPQWRGPDRNGVSAETGLLKQWPPAGPPLSWSVSSLGKGYGSMAVQGGYI